MNINYEFVDEFYEDEEYTTLQVIENKSEIGLCTLSAFVLDNFDWQDQDKINELAEVQVRALDNLLEYPGYDVS